MSTPSQHAKHKNMSEDVPLFSCDIAPQTFHNQTVTLPCVGRLVWPIGPLLPQLLLLAGVLLQSVEIDGQECHDGVDCLHSREQAEDELLVLRPGLALVCWGTQSHPHQAGQQQPQLWVTEGCQTHHVHLLHGLEGIGADKLQPCTV